MALIIELGPVGSFISGVVASLTLLGGLMYWMIKSALGVATKGYVQRQVNQHVDPIEAKVDRTAQLAKENREDMRALRDLLEGGSSQFEKGMMDFLDDNIKRTIDIQEDLDEIKVGLRELRSDVDEQESPRE